MQSHARSSNTAATSSHMSVTVFITVWP